MTTADKKHKLGKWHKMGQQFKSITSEVLNYIIADTHWELVCNGRFHLGIDRVYIINHWYLNDKSFPLRSHRKGYSPFSLPPLFLLTITFILIIMFSFILIMFGERIEAHGFSNTITVWRARQSCRMTATCMTAASFPDAYQGVEWWGSAGQPLHCHILEYPKGTLETLLPWRVSHGDYCVCTGGNNCQTSRISGLLSASGRSSHELCSHFHSYTWRLICEIAWPHHMLWRYHARYATLPIINYQIYYATSQQDQDWFDLCSWKCAVECTVIWLLLIY